MVGQALFYEQASALSSERHAGWSIEQGRDFAYARNTNSVPLMAVEFLRSAAEYPVMFAAAGNGEVLPVAVLGLQMRQNVFIGPDGGWTGRYIPAFVRRYPFIFAADGDRSRLTLCIDESYGGFNEEGRGERMFGDDGKPSAYLSRMLGFLGEYQAQHERTLEFTRWLREHGVLEEVRAEVTLPAGAKTSLDGVLAVNRERMLGLGDELLAGAVRNGHMELVYLHWQSVQRFPELAAQNADSSASPAAAG